MFKPRTIKDEIRIVGWDDAPFSFSQKKLNVFGVVMRGGLFMDGLLKTSVDVDGDNATEKITSRIKSSRHRHQVRILMFDGITLGGFNIVDMKTLYKKTKMPVIAISRKKPNMKKIKKALKRFGDFKKRWKLIENAGRVKPYKVRGKTLYYKCAGIRNRDAEKIIKTSCTRSLIPEPLRIAHLIASGVTDGESRGRA